ncbi:MAG: hypothetical protein QMD04_04605 [Anaerolineales bacterium]|nr:hypothetical protein [Anaerolineales bacterium]
MSKRRKQKQKKLPVPLIGLVIGGILLIAAAIFLFSGGSFGGGKPALAVDQRVIDYGEVKYNTPKTFAITVTNTGDGVLRFAEQPYIETLEGC